MDPGEVLLERRLIAFQTGDGPELADDPDSSSEQDHYRDGGGSSLHVPNESAHPNDLDKDYRPSALLSLKAKTEAQFV